MLPLEVDTQKYMVLYLEDLTTILTQPASVAHNYVMLYIVSLRAPAKMNKYKKLLSL